MCPLPRPATLIYLNCYEWQRVPHAVNKRKHDQHQNNRRQKKSTKPKSHSHFEAELVSENKNYNLESFAWSEQLFQGHKTMKPHLISCCSVSLTGCSNIFPLRALRSTDEAKFCLRPAKEHQLVQVHLSNILVCRHCQEVKYHPPPPVSRKFVLSTLSNQTCADVKFFKF